MAAQGLRICHLYADSPGEWNCSQWRCLTPADALNGEHEAGRTPHTARLFYLPSALEWHNPEVQKTLGMFDVLIFQRNVILPEVWAAMSYWRAIGKTVCIDIDDMYSQLPPSNPAHNFWTRNAPGLDPDPVAALIEAMRHADALTAPSRVLLADFDHVVKGYYVPNYTRRLWYAGLTQKPAGAPDVAFGYAGTADAPELAQTARGATNGQVYLGWGGSISHVDSWLYSGVVPALDRLFEKHPHVYLKFCGHETRLDDLVFKRWGDRVVKQGGVKPEHWPLVVSTFDIGLAPLDTRPLDPPWRPGAPVASYDERRSWLKGVEYLTAGVPWVASESATYADLRRWGTLVPNTEAAWFAALDDMVTRLPHHKAVAWDRRRWALRKVTMEANANAYGDIFGRIMAERGARAGARLPGVRYVAAAQAVAA
jgi:hypothetical protein